MKYRDPFVGKRLEVFANTREYCGTILDWKVVGNIITFYTTMGEYSFYRVHPSKQHRNLKLLKNGDWKLHGDAPRWALVRTDAMTDLRRW